MKFSIITPSYNQGLFITDCVESVLAQSGIDFEHIITEAGSMDETFEVLRRYPHLNWGNGLHNNMSGGINNGFRKATRDWLMWLNCYDYLLPGALEKITEFIKLHSDVDVRHLEYIHILKDKTPIRQKYDTSVDKRD